MADVGVTHDEAVAADGGPGIGLSAAVDAGKLADDGAVADAAIGPFAAEVEVLREVADDGGVNLAVGARSRSSGEVGIGIDLRARSDLHMAFNGDKRPNVRGGVDFRMPVDDRRRMNRHNAREYPRIAVAPNRQRRRRFHYNHQPFT